MGRLRRFPHNRFLGLRDEMVVYDCDDDGQFAALSARVDDEGMVDRLLVQSFGPDTLAEAGNRGFRPPQ